ncbi:MAG TPA: tetratricopeptide repeat protein [Bradyrhizobium sp.]|nr:tetratricopeptide repeat protein [Bradyrhizobium sp.]
MARAVAAISAGIVLVLNLTTPAPADSLADAVAAYRRADYASALRLYHPLAEQGLAIAQFNVGLMHDIGQGVPQNSREAFKWYRLAADQGRPDAQYQLGHLYYKQDDYTEAAKWFRLAAEQGRADAQSSLGAMYAEGEAGPQDLVQALKWFILAAAQNHKEATENREKAVLIMTARQVAEAQKLANESKARTQSTR